MVNEEDALAAMGITDGEYSHPEAEVGDIDEADIESALRSFLDADDGESERHKPREGVNHASKGWHCARKRFYQDKGLSDPFPGGIGKRGNFIEDYYVEEAFRVFFDDDRVANAIPVKYEGDGYYITGSTDPAVLSEDLQEIVMLTEVKSMSKSKFDSVDFPDHYGPVDAHEAVDRNEYPAPKHVVQLNTYLCTLGLEIGYIIYVSASNFGNFRIVPIWRSDSLWEMTKSLHNMYTQDFKSNTLPEAMPLQEDECKWCSFQQICEKNKHPDEVER